MHRLMASTAQRFGMAAARFKRRVVAHRRGAKPDIALLAIRRGGSTLLAQMIGANRGVWFANEPEAAFDGHQQFELKRRYLPPKPHCQYFDLDPEEAARFRGYFALLSRAALPLGNCQRPKFPLVSDRVLLKILNAPAMIDWFAEELGMSVVFLTRHPAPQALSVIRNGWGYSAEAYFAHPTFLGAYYDEAQVEYGRRILAEGSDWQKAILNWVVENDFPLRRATRPVLRLTYEELTLCTPQVVDRLCDRLDLDEPDRMLAMAERPSGSSRMSTGERRAMIASRSRGELIRDWRRKIDDRQREQAQEILSTFGIAAYSMGELVATRDLLLFPDEVEAAL